MSDSTCSFTGKINSPQRLLYCISYRKSECLSEQKASGLMDGNRRRESRPFQRHLSVCVCVCLKTTCRVYGACQYTYHIMTSCGQYLLQANVKMRVLRRSSNSRLSSDLQSLHFWAPISSAHTHSHTQTLQTPLCVTLRVPDSHINNL